jgi:glutathione synthase
MKKYRILVLTDHSGHSAENSIYAILSAMRKHDSCAVIDVATRSNKANNAFFEHLEFDQLHVLRLMSDFIFDPSQQNLVNGTKTVDPLSYDVVFLRLPRPISDAFLFKMDIFFKGILMINNPYGISVTSTKKYLLNFPELCPPMQLCHSIEEVLSFSQNRDIVLKPLKEYGGKGLIRLTGDLVNDGTRDWDKMQYLKGLEENIKNEGYLAMQYLKNVDQGDKRLLVVDGEILASSLRLPAKDSWLCNVAQGGTSVYSEPTRREYEIVNALHPKLKALGIFIYGADTLVDDDGKRILSELNTLSIGGFPQAQEQTGRPVIQSTLDKFFNYADRYYGQRS